MPSRDIQIDLTDRQAGTVDYVLGRDLQSCTVWLSVEYEDWTGEIDLKAVTLRDEKVSLPDGVCGEIWDRSYEEVCK